MNRPVAGSPTQNQIDVWEAMSPFETPPKTPYQAALESAVKGQLGTVPATATVDSAPLSTSTQLRYCHRPMPSP